MVSWTLVPLRVLVLDVGVEAGDRVPGRVVALEVFRRTGRCEGIEVGAEADAIDWTGLEEAVAWLDQQDVHGPQGVRVPRAQA